MREFQIRCMTISNTGTGEYRHHLRRCLAIFSCRPCRHRREMRNCSHEKPEAVKLELENWLKDLEYHDEWFKRHPVQVEWFGAQWLPNDLPDDHL